MFQYSGETLPTPSPATLAREKKRSRSKSPFKFFSRKKNNESSRSLGVDLRLTEQAPSGTSTVHEEGSLSRKNEMDAHMKKASNRSWDKVFVVVHGPSLSCYKNSKHAKQDPSSRFHHEPALDLSGAECEYATDYTKRPHVFRLRLANGAEYLFMAKDQVEMDNCIGIISSTCPSAETTPGPSQTMTARTDEQYGKDTQKEGFYCQGETLQTPSPATLPREKKQTGMSKSPFKFFSRKKNNESSGSLGADLRPTEQAPSGTSTVHEEGSLSRQHEMDAHMKKASNRSWDKVFVVVHGTSLSCYKDSKQAKLDPSSRIHHEPALDLSGAECEYATDYTKRPHVFGLRLANGAEYLFMAKDQAEMDNWIRIISSTSLPAETTPGRSQTIPVRTDEQKEKGTKKQAS